MRRGLNLRTARNLFGWTPAHYAAEYGHAGIMHDIIHVYRGHFDSLSRSSETPAHRAARAGHVDVLTVLLDAGADMFSQNAAGSTPPDLAIQMRRRDAVALLVDRGFVDDSEDG